MNIVEKEIARRQVVIDGKEAKIAEVESLKAKIDELEAEIAAIDVTALEAEIAELETFLPNEEETVFEDE